MAAPATISTPSTSPIDSLASLYDLINGKTTSTSGGTQTRTESSSVSQEAMNEMLKSALSSSSGLAAVAGGQRTAGGYGSSTNQLLVNDLLTRSAGQIAQANSTKTTTVTTPTTKTTTGGVTASGTGKVTALLGLAKSLQGSSSESWLKKQLGIGGGTGGTEATSAQGVGVTANDFSTSSADSLSLGSNPSSNPLEFSVSDLNQVSFSDPISFTDTSGSTDYSSENLVDVGIDPGSISYSGGMEEDPLAFLEDFGMADGGQVKPKKPGILSTSQFNTAKEAVNASQEGGYNASVSSPAVGANISVSADQRVVSSSGGSGSDRTVGGTANSSFSPDTRGLVSDLGSAARALGTISKNQDLGMVGTVLGVAGSANPVASAGLTVANMATKGLAGAAFGLSKNPSVGSVVDIAGAISNPAVGVANTVLGMLGLNSLGTAAENAYASATVDGPTRVSESFNPMTQAVLAQQQNVSENAPIESAQNAAIAAVSSDMEGDALDNMIGITDGFGTIRGDSSSRPGVTQGANYGNGSFGSGFGSENSDRGPGGSSGTSDGQDSGLADGSLVRAPGDGTTDTKMVPLANGEYVLPADVVAKIGVAKLDAIKAKYHTPVAVQKLQKFARG